MDALVNAEFVSYPVPGRFLPRVSQFVAKLYADESDQEIDGEDALELDEALIERIYNDSEDPHRRLFEYLADRPDEWIYSDALAAGLGLKHGSKSLAGTLGALGRRANHRYDGRKPFASEWDPTAWQARHMMTADVAKVIKAITGT